MESFQRIQEGKSSSIVVSMTQSQKDRAAKNRKTIYELFDCMILCLMRGFSMKAHQDR